MKPHTDDCLCRRCHKRRYIACLITPKADHHPDHLVPECPSHPEPTIGTEATCRTCRRRIVYEVVEEYGYLPRTGWSDGFPRDALVCFRSLDYRHLPTHAAVRAAMKPRPKAAPRRDPEPTDLRSVRERADKETR